MSLTTLSDDYQDEQARLRKQATDRLAEVFPSLNFRDLDSSAPGWVLAVEKVTSDLRVASTDLAKDVYTAYRREAGVTGKVTFVLPDGNGGKLRAALLNEGPYTAKHLLSGGARISDVAKGVFASTTGAGLLYGQEQSRDLMKLTSDSDRKATGYIRLTSSKPCGFCVMNALNVYRSEASAGKDYHPHDKCVAAPRFGDALPDGYGERMDQFQDVYDQSVVTVTRRGGQVIDSKQTIRNMNALMRH